MSDERRVIWQGHLDRGEEAGTVTGWIQDTWGWRIHITGTRDPAGGYVLEATVGEPPASLRVPIVDDPVGKDG